MYNLLRQKLVSREGLIALIIVLVGTGSYGLGILSVKETSRQPITIEREADLVKKVGVESQVAGVGESTLDSGVVVASKTGAKYHYPWCAGARTISEKNLVTFNSIEDARKAGYTPASNCKGLK